MGAGRVWLLGFALALAAASACSASGDNDDNGGSGATGPGGGAAAGGTGGLGFGGGGGEAPGDGCSADLQSVVDANGNVVEACPPDQGCYDGACIPACDAAAQSKGSIGCEFWAPDPPFLSNGPDFTQLDGPCYAVFLANTWGRAANITVTRGGQSFDVTTFGRIPSGIAPNTTYAPIPAGGLPPNEVAVLFLSHQPGVTNFTSLECPVPPAVLQDAAVGGSGIGSAFHVESDTPVTAYDILPYGGATSYLPSATLLFPSTAWGTNYVAVAPHNTGSGSLWAMVVATEDNTTIDVAPTTDLLGGGGLATAPAGQVTSIVLNAGEMAQWLDPAIGAMDPTSAVFQGDKPFGLFTGNTYLGVGTQTSGPGGQDSAHQQIPPVQALGNQYVGAGVPTRLTTMGPESVPYRLMGVVDGTTLTWDPAPPVGAPTTLQAGQYAEFETTTPFVVTSQDEDHPFAFTQYLPGAPSVSRPGCGPVPPFPGLECGLGDEEWVSLVPPKQFLQRYVFFTDPTYATTNLVLVRVKGASGYADVDIECLGTVSGWQPVGASDAFEYAHVDLVRGTVPVAGCNTSRHVAASDGAFGVVVWGTDYYSSYGYPAGGNVGAINDVVVPPTPE
jgi:hypothetical protein